MLKEKFWKGWKIIYCWLLLNDPRYYSRKAGTLAEKLRIPESWRGRHGMQQHYIVDNLIPYKVEVFWHNYEWYIGLRYKSVLYAFNNWLGLNRFEQPKTVEALKELWVWSFVFSCYLIFAIALLDKFVFHVLAQNVLDAFLVSFVIQLDLVFLVYSYLKTGKYAAKFIHHRLKGD